MDSFLTYVKRFLLILNQILELAMFGFPHWAAGDKLQLLEYPIIAQRVKFGNQPPHLSIRSHCEINMADSYI